jgi:hypothetical protein
MRVAVGGTGNVRTGGHRPRPGVGALLASVASIVALAAGTATGPPAGAASPVHPDAVRPGVIARALPVVASGPLGRALGAPGRDAAHAPAPRDVTPSCTFNGEPGPLLSGVTPGEAITLDCAGWLASDTVVAFEISPLALATGSPDDTDVTHAQQFTTDGAGNLRGTFTVPDPFTAVDPAAVCPPTVEQVDAGFLRCGILLSDGVDSSPGYVGVDAVALDYATAAVPATSTASVVGMASTPDGNGYWLAWNNGLVTPHGDALGLGDASRLSLNSPIAHIVATPDGLGYWLVAGDGGTFAFGDAGFFGSMGGTTLNRPVVDLAPTADGGGYWLVASDGGIFAFGDAAFHGSMGGQPLNRPVVGLAADGATGGYWEVASDGGIFAFGAPFHGSTGNLPLNRPINGMTATADFGGYLFVASDGGVFAFGDAVFAGSTGALTLNAPVVGMAIDPATDGYWLVAADGGVFAFDAPYLGAR